MRGPRTRLFQEKNFTGPLRRPAPVNASTCCFPARIADDGDLLEVIAMAEEKVRIAPLLATLPAGEVFQQHEELDRSSTSDFFHELGLHGIEFGFFQFAADAQDEKANVMLFESGTH